MDDKRHWVEANHPLLSVRQQCEILDLPRSSIYLEFGHIAQP